MNSTVLIGRLTKDPELKFAQGTGTAVATFTLAVNRRFKKEGQPDADFIPVVVFGKQAEATANYMTKGSQLSVSGAIQTRSYDAKDGTKRYVTEVMAEHVEFLGSKKQQESNTSNGFENEITEIDPDLIPF